MNASLAHDTRPAPSIDYRIEFLVSYRLWFRLPPEMIGPTPEGLRINFYLGGGELSGPRLNG